MLNIGQITEGFINATKKKFGSADPKVEDKAAKRYEICLNCPLISEGKTRCDKNKCENNKCGCNCFLAWKTRSSSKCPTNRW